MKKIIPTCEEETSEKPVKNVLCTEHNQTNLTVKHCHLFFSVITTCDLFICQKSIKESMLSNQCRLNETPRGSLGLSGPKRTSLLLLGEEQGGPKGPGSPWEARGRPGGGGGGPGRPWPGGGGSLEKEKGKGRNRPEKEGAWLDSSQASRGRRRVRRCS